jgi:hypothetical protein
MDDQEPSPLGSFLLEPAAVDAAGSAPDGGHRPRSRLRLIRNVTLVVLLATAIVVGVLVGPTAWQLLREKDATIDTPAQVAGLTRDDTGNTADAADYLRTAVAAQAPVDHSVAAVYTDHGDAEHGVIFVGGTGLMLRPEKELDGVFGLITDQADGVEGVRREPTGPLGGVLKCGTTKIEDISVAVCGWADHGSLAVALFARRGVDEAADLMRRMRDAMQHRH